MKKGSEVTVLVFEIMNRFWQDCRH